MIMGILRTGSPSLLMTALALCLGLMTSCSDGSVSPSEVRSSRSYQGHASDADINNFVTAYQHTVGTRLDDCQTCHRGAEVTDDAGDPVHANPCDYCHYVIHPPDGWSGLPTSVGADAQSIRNRI